MIHLFEAFSESTKCSLGLVFHAAAKCGIAQITSFCWLLFCVVGSGLWCVQYWICHWFGQSIVTTHDTSGFVLVKYHVFNRWTRLACTDRHPCFGIFWRQSISFSHYNHGAAGVEEEQFPDPICNSQLASGVNHASRHSSLTRWKNCMFFPIKNWRLGLEPEKRQPEMDRIQSSLQNPSCLKGLQVSISILWG